MQNSNRRGLVLYSEDDSIYSHICRILVHEKDAECEVRYSAESAEHVISLGEVNPYAETPTLLDRDLALYDVGLIAEYLDERLPYPPLMTVDPAGRGRIRLMIHRIRRDWLDSIHVNNASYKNITEQQQQLIRDGLISMSPILKQHKWLMGNDYSLADAYMSPLLWRLSVMGVRLPKSALPVIEYAGRLFARKAFQQSLTASEREIRLQGRTES
ncbi:MAG: RNA polymerase-associated protein [Parasphingorhabdus sp.]|jgi:RNA polymerase-associated protein